MKTTKLTTSRLNLIGLAASPTAALVFALVTGCSEAPVAYRYEPSQSQMVDLANITVEVINTIYRQADEAAGFLESAALTSDYSTILPAGWYGAIDSSGQPVYIRNYLDQKYNFMWFDRVPTTDIAIRRPASVDHQYVQVGSFFNDITSQPSPSLMEDRAVHLNYASNLQDPLNVEGWLRISRTVEFEYEIVIEGPNGSFKVSQNYPQEITWLARIENYSLSSVDQTGRIYIEGVFPQIDEEGVQQQSHLGFISTFNSAGVGKGIMSMDGKPAFELEFRGRLGYGFRFNYNTLR